MNRRELLAGAAAVAARAALHATAPALLFDSIPFNEVRDPWMLNPLLRQFEWEELRDAFQALASDSDRVLDGDRTQGVGMDVKET